MSKANIIVPASGKVTLKGGRLFDGETGAELEYCPFCDTYGAHECQKGGESE